MNTRQTAWVAIATLTAAALGFAGARALATGAPQLSPLTYGGVLTDKDGKPYPSAQEVVLKFYDKVDATAAKCTAPATQAEAGTGRFSVVLPGECAQAVRDTPDLWSEATVGGGKTVLPRVHVGAVPYALEADSAKVAAGATGALKVAMDGVTADVAGLKKGGGPKVVDGAGVVLGTLTEAGPAVHSFVTSKGYAILMYPTGEPYNPVEPLFESANCAGQGFRDASNTSFQSTGVFPTYSAFTKSWYVEAIGANGWAVVKQFFPASVNKSSGCDKVGTGAKTGYPLTKVTPAELGLPDKITAPLKIVP